jgi:hypothetical protein
MVAVGLTPPLALPSASAADGLPLPVDGVRGTGVTSLDGQYHYATVPAGAHGNRTVALRIDADGGEIERTRNLDGVRSVPLVAYDNTPSGLSADGQTLVLIEPRVSFPRPTTTFTVLDTDRLRPRSELTLRGDYSFDALSPDGRTLYLIQYTEPRDPTSYQVRAYDLERRRLLPDPIVDPSEAPEVMAGFPQTRATSPDGRWEYTLYETADRHHPPFIHALDTERGVAACIDLDPLADQRNNLFRMDLEPSPDGSSLSVVDRGQPLVTVDTETFDVTEVPPPTAASSRTDEGFDPGWLALGAGAVLLAGVAVLIRRRGQPDDPNESVTEDDLERLLAGESDEREQESKPEHVA